jgi:hypothetical protein
MQLEAARLIHLPDSAYEGLDEDALSALSIRFSDFIGAQSPAPENAAEARAIPIMLVAAAPSRVTSLEGRQWPFLVGRYTSGWASWVVNWRLNGRVIIADLQSGNVSTRLLTIREKTADRRQSPPVPSMSTAEPDDFKAATISAGVTRYFPFFNLVQPKHALPARFAFTAISFDSKSNTVITTVAPPDGTPPPPPTKRPHATATMGVQVLTATEIAPKAGSFRAPAHINPGSALPVEVSLDFTVEQGAVIATPPGGSESGPDGLLSVTLLLLNRDAEFPLTISLWVPAHLHGPVGPGQRATAAFSVDVNQFHETADLRGLFQIYVVAGAQTLGPQPVVMGQLDGHEALLVH